MLEVDSYFAIFNDSIIVSLLIKAVTRSGGAFRAVSVTYDYLVCNGSGGVGNYGYFTSCNFLDPACEILGKIFLTVFCLCGNNYNVLGDIVAGDSQLAVLEGVNLLGFVVFGLIVLGVIVFVVLVVSLIVVSIVGALGTGSGLRLRCGALCRLLLLVTRNRKGHNKGQCQNQG